MNSRHFTAITTHTFSSQNEDCLYILIRISFFYLYAVIVLELFWCLRLISIAFV